ncbi:MAG: transposase [Acidobacteria bacterium]|nr:transposase [Acidobacteriota bacterium]
MARLRSNGSYVIEHCLVQRDGYFEALIFLGAHRSDRSAYLMRLVRVRYRGQWYSYISNITDPLQLSGGQIVQLYARRWDIELGFRLLKDHLGLNLLWSAKMNVIGAQLWATVILAQLLHALQVQVAVEAGVETFDVSLEGLWRYLPELAELASKQRVPLVQAILQVGRAIKLIRPSTRIRRVVPEIDWQEITPPPIDLTWRREPRYAQKSSAPGSHRTKKAKKEPGII